MGSKRSNVTKRVFMLQVVTGVGLLAVGQSNEAFAADKLVPTDPYPKSMGFKLDTNEVDQVKYPRHTAEQACRFCQLWDGGTADFGSCSFFDGAITPKTGWCKNFKVKKAAG
jgi:hypothetical protein